MPIPNPQSGESQDEFVSRCIKEIYEDYNDEKQSAAICYSKYRDVNMSKADRLKELVSHAMNAHPGKLKVKMFSENKTSH